MQRSAIVGTTNQRKAAVTETNPWSAEGYDHHARFVSELAGGVFDWLAPKPGERILDLGCGDGALTERLVAAGASVLGIDHSPSMLDAARERGLDVRTGDARQLDFDTEFDAVFSNAVLHWVRLCACPHGSGSSGIRQERRLISRCQSRPGVKAHELTCGTICVPFDYKRSSQYLALICNLLILIGKIWYRLPGSNGGPLDPQLSLQ